MERQNGRTSKREGSIRETIMDVQRDELQESAQKGTVRKRGLERSINSAVIMDERRAS